MEPHPRSPIARYALFGEGNGAIAPEFVHIEPISRRSRLHGWTISPHAHPGIAQVLLLAEGAGELASDGARVDLGAGALVLLPSGCVHAFRFTEQAEGWVLSLAADLLGDPRISGVRGAALARSGQSRWTQLAPSGGLAARLVWLLADLAEDLATPRPGPLDDSLASRLALVLAWSAEALAEGPAPRPASPRATLAARFRTLVDLHFRDRWPIPRYAHELGTTPVTLTRCCREELGRAPGDVVLDRVLLEALRLLTYTSASASQIAGELGFAEPGYFARFFRARTGLTATAFRRSRGWLEGRPAGG